MEFVTFQKAVTIHMRGIESADTYTPMAVNHLVINGQFVTFTDAEGRPWKTELSEVSGITITDKP